MATANYCHFGPGKGGGKSLGVPHRDNTVGLGTEDLDRALVICQRLDVVPVVLQHPIDKKGGEVILGYQGNYIKRNDEYQLVRRLAKTGKI